MRLRGRGLLWAATCAALLVAAVPLLVTLMTGLRDVRFRGDIGAGSGVVIILMLVYVVWLPATAVGLVWVLDRLGYNYTVTERRRRPGRRERRRLGVGLRFLGRRPTLGQGAAAQRGGAAAAGEPAGDEARPRGDAPRRLGRG